MSYTKINVEILKRGKSKIKEVLTFTATSNEIIIQSTKAWINEVMNLTSSSIFTYQITSGNVPKMNTLHDIKSKKWKDLMKSQIPFSQSCYRGQTAVLRQTPNFDWACSWQKTGCFFFLQQQRHLPKQVLYYHAAKNMTHWLYIIISSKRSRVNLHSIFAWMSRKPLLETGAISEVEVTG